MGLDRWEWDPVSDGLAPFICNSPLWRLADIEGPCLALLDNTALDEDGGKVALVGVADWTDVSIEAQMRFLKGRGPDDPRRGWFGFALRAMDVHNYELFWLMPQHTGEVGAVAYVPVAHGIVPWWTEGYSKQTFGRAVIPANEWFSVRAEVVGRTARLTVNGEPALERTLSYYLNRGKVGFYVGTLTDTAFRRVRVRALDKELPLGD
ncbi:MAG: hypothetical protein M0Z94_00105 [Dehalococcoidales bacterium]|nr:hypothetical protein [Dehalococcoidales bacterium]